MERVLVGVDGSATSLDALRWAADLAGRVGAELVAARIFAPPQAELPPDFDAEAHDDELAELDGWCSELGGQARVRTVVLDGSAAESLLQYATDQHVDLIVVGGRTGHRLTGRHLGSTSHHLVHSTTVPLAVVHAGGATPVDHVIVGVDGSDPSLAAAKFAADLAESLGVGATAVYALDPMPEWVEESDPRSWRSQARKAARAWSDPLAERGVTVEIDIERETHPVAALTEVIEQHPGSATVVGARGLGGFTELRLGHVPLQLIEHTNSPTIVVPA